MTGLAEIVESFEGFAPFLVAVHPSVLIGQGVVGRYIVLIHADGSVQIGDGRVALAEFGSDLSRVIEQVWIVGIGAGDRFQRLQGPFVILTLGIENQPQGVVGLEQGGIVLEGGLEGDGGTVVFTQTVVGDAQVGVADGIMWDQTDSSFEFRLRPRVVVLIHIDDPLVVVPAGPGGNAGSGGLTTADREKGEKRPTSEQKEAVDLDAIPTHSYILAP